MKILLTGFNPFGSLEINPSQLIVEIIRERTRASERPEVVTEVLPTEFNRAGTRIQELIRQVRPSVVVSLGVAQSRDAISLERVALNLNDADVPDNQGIRAAGRLIVAEGPAAYWSTLPLERIRQALQQRGIRVHISNHAGTFVCNHVFYVARHEIEQLGCTAQCGFIHVPPLSPQTETPGTLKKGLSLEAMIEAIECCLEVVQDEVVVR